MKSYGLAAEASSESRRRRHFMPWRQAWRTAAKFAGVGLIGFGIVATALVNLPLLGWISVGALIALGLIAFVRYCTPST